MMSSTVASNDRFGLIVVSAPSGAGKSTLCAALLKNLSSRLALSISSTSRAPRGQESHGKEYFFLSADQFRQQIDQGFFVEWANVHGNYYGTSRETLDLFWSQGRHVLLDIDVQGADSLRHAFGPRAFTVFIAPPSMEVLESRLRGRGTDSEDVIRKRMENAITEMKQRDYFDFVVVNDDFEKAYRDLEAAVISFMDRLEGRNG
jgi:guanylate kinase